MKTWTINIIAAAMVGMLFSTIAQLSVWFAMWEINEPNWKLLRIAFSVVFLWTLLDDAAKAWKQRRSVSERGE